MATRKVRKTMYLSKQRAIEVETFAKNLGISESKFLAVLLRSLKFKNNVSDQCSS